VDKVCSLAVGGTRLRKNVNAVVSGQWSVVSGQCDLRSLRRWV
jgi:hypothetical protein